MGWADSANGDGLKEPFLLGGAEAIPQEGRVAGASLEEPAKWESQDGSQDGTPGPAASGGEEEGQEEELQDSVQRSSTLIAKLARLEPKEHVLITTGPCLYMVGDNAQTYHGGALIRGVEGKPFKDRHTMDPRSACIFGAFRRPWLRVPKGGCLNPRLRRPSDKHWWNAHVVALVLLTFIVVHAVFFAGNPKLLETGGVDFLGNVCGEGDGPVNYRLVKNGVGAKWQNMTYLWYPLDNSVSTAKLALGMGLCVTECPTWTPGCGLPGQEPCPRRTLYAFERGLKPPAVNPLQECCADKENYCPPATLPPRERLNTHCLRQFKVEYPTSPLDKLCVPNEFNLDWNNLSTGLATEALALREQMPLYNDLWFMFTADMVKTRMGVAASLLACFAFGEAYLLGIRLSPFWVPWASFFICLVTMTITVVLLLEHEDDDPLRRGTSSLTALIVIIILCMATACVKVYRMRKKMDLGSQLMLEALRALRETPGMGFVAPWFFLMQFVLCVVAWIILEYIGTAHSITEDESWLSSNGWGGQYTTLGATASEYHETNHSLKLSPARGAFLLFLVIVFLWTMSAVNAACYGITAHICVHWYYSHEGDIKKPSMKAMSNAVAAMWKHLGSYSVGAVLLLFEIVREVFEDLLRWIRELFDRLGEVHRIVRWLTCVPRVVLVLFDKFFRFLRRDAYVIQCIEGRGYFPSASRAEELLEQHKLRVRELARVSDGVALCGRLSVLSCTALFTVVILTATEFGKDTFNLPMLIYCLVFLGSFIVKIYGNILHAAVDSLILCFCYDIDVHDGSKKRPYFVHTALRELVDAHTEIENDYRNFAEGFTLSEGIGAATQIAKQAHRKIQEEAKKRQAQLEKSGKHIVQQTGKVKEKTQSLARGAVSKVGDLAKESADAAASSTKKAGRLAFGGVKGAIDVIDKAAALGGSEASPRSLAASSPRGSPRHLPGTPRPARPPFRRPSDAPKTTGRRDTPPPI